MRVYTVHTARNTVTYESLASALRTIAFHRRFGGDRPIHLTSHVTPWPAR